MNDNEDIVNVDDEISELNRYGLTYNEGKFYIKSLNDTRKPRLTLTQLNKLKRISTKRKIENEKRSEQLSSIYGKSSE